MMTIVTDRIVKQAVLPAPLARVWRAVSQSAEFGRWFGMAIDGEFVPGATLQARMVPTEVDAEVAAQQKAHEGLAVQLYVEQVEPMRLLSFRWHPYPVDSADGSPVPTTLVAFQLEELDGATRLTVSESGFDNIPVERRARAFADNEGGWEIQTRLIARYLEHAAD
jgi:uncharacterized protein YndB with AHSA1/START domain